MAADKDDYFQKVGRSTATTLSAPGYTIGNTTINVASTANWGDSTGVTFAIDEVDSDGARIASTYNVFRGVVSSATQVSDLEYVGGDANRDYSAGATTRVYVTVSSYRDNRLIDGILVHADQDGTLKAGAVDNAAVLANDVVETAKIKDLNVTTGKLADGAVTPAKWTNPYCFRAYASGSTTLTDGTYVKVLFASENYDYNNNFASSTYTAPVAGVYNFSSTVTQATVSATPAIIFLTLYVNGSAAARGVAFTPSTVGVPCVTYAGDVLLAANDTVEIYCYQDSAGNEATITGSELTFFSGHLVHKV